MEGLLLLQQSCKVDVQAQTSPPVESSNSPVNPTTPTLVYVPVDSCVTRPFGRKLFEGNYECTKFYTGLTSWSILKHLVTFLSTLCLSLVSVQSKLSPLDSVLTLMRLRLNLHMEDIAYRFDIGASTACNIFRRNIDLMSCMPTSSFSSNGHHKRYAVPICRRCSKISSRALIASLTALKYFIEHPCSYQARAQTYSNYQKHNKVKFLIGITPCGAVF